MSDPHQLPGIDKEPVRLMHQMRTVQQRQPREVGKSPDRGRVHPRTGEPLAVEGRPRRRHPNQRPQPPLLVTGDLLSRRPLHPTQRLTHRPTKRERVPNTMLDDREPRRRRHPQNLHERQGEVSHLVCAVRRPAWDRTQVPGGIAGYPPVLASDVQRHLASRAQPQIGWAARSSHRVDVLLDVADLAPGSTALARTASREGRTSMGTFINTSDPPPDLYRDRLQLRRLGPNVPAHTGRDQDQVRGRGPAAEVP